MASVGQAEYFADNFQLKQSRRSRQRNNAYETMSKFDFNLIYEPKSRPELYVRNSTLFKDKLHIWLRCVIVERSHATIAKPL